MPFLLQWMKIWKTKVFFSFSTTHYFSMLQWKCEGKIPPFQLHKLQDISIQSYNLYNCLFTLLLKSHYFLSGHLIEKYIFSQISYKLQIFGRSFTFILLKNDFIWTYLSLQRAPWELIIFLEGLNHLYKHMIFIDLWWK